MSRSDLVLHGLMVAALSLVACGPGRGPTNTPAPGKTGLFVTYNNTYDQPGDDDGGAKQWTDVPIVWSGERVLGAEETEQAGDTFTVDDSWSGYATEPWYKNAAIGNLNPGDWKLHVLVNGMPFDCPSPIALPEGKQNNVTFEIDKVTGQFAGCTHN